MHPQKTNLVRILAIIYIAAPGTGSAQSGTSGSRRSWLDPRNSSSTALDSFPTALVTPFLSSSDIPIPQTILNTAQNTSAPPEPTHNPPQTPILAPSKPPSETSTQIPLVDLRPTLHHDLNDFDVTTCLEQSHCLVCLDPSTTLACYKFSCQCQSGKVSSAYMPASKYSCHQQKLCMTCPGRSMPFIWGRMAVCLNIWSHKPIEGEKNPSTNWTESGLAGNPVAKVYMGHAIGLKLFSWNVGILILWVTVSIIVLS